MEWVHVLYEDDTILAVNKPAGLVCHPTKGDETSSLIGRLRLHLGGQTTPRMINRLDRETSGIVLAAKTVEAAGSLGKLWESREVMKEYLAVVHGHVLADAGVVDAPLGHDTLSPVAIKDCVCPQGAPAQTSYTVIQRFDRDGRPFTLLRVAPQTGRKHQIRIHLAHAGHPIVGDKIYGGDERLYLAFVTRQLTAAQQQQLILPFQALHAGEVSFSWRDQPWHFRAPPESWFQDFVEKRPIEYGALMG